MCESMYSHKIDEWSVGCILLEMVIGSPPFRGKPECTCQCPQVTHRNFNSDQLARKSCRQFPVRIGQSGCRYA